MAVIPRQKGETVECNSCGWQGKRNDTDSGYCPECGDECYALEEIYGDEDGCQYSPPSNAKVSGAGTASAGLPG